MSGGIANVFAVISPDAKIYTCEPQGFDKMKRSLAEGCRLSNDQASGSICDALLAPTPGMLPFDALLRVSARGLSVSDAEIKVAMRLAFTHFRLVLEPGGAAALAAALSTDFRPSLRDRVTVVVASGGNVDPAFFSAVLAEPADPSSPQPTVIP